ncbi:MAG: FG-GAP repeat domain-containing protein, partial [Pseudomonadales bacterium]
PLGRDLVTSYATELADLDQDGDLDIAVGNDNAPNAIFLNDGHGHFRHHASFGQPSSIRSLTLFDIDQDGDTDILANARGKPNLIFFNDGSANFPTSQSFGNAVDSTIDVAVADLNNDGHPDLVLANRDGQQNVVLLNDFLKSGQTRFTQRIPFGNGRDDTRAVAAFDLDGDGNLDWVTGNIRQSNVIYFGDGKGGVIKTLNFGLADGQTYTIAIADMDNDGHLDIIVGNIAQSNAVFFNHGDGKQFREVRFGDPSQATYNLAVGDLNQNGYLDIAVANSDTQNLIYLNLPLKQ